MTQSQLASDHPSDPWDREELEDLFSFTTPTIEFTNTAESLSNDASSAEVDDLFDFENQIGFLTASISDSALPDPISSWESIITFKDDSDHPSSLQNLQNCNAGVPFDEETKEILGWLDRTNKPSKHHTVTSSLGDGEEIYRLLENEIRQIFDCVGCSETSKQYVGNPEDRIGNISTGEWPMSATLSPMLQDILGSQSNVTGSVEPGCQENGNDRNGETFFITDEAVSQSTAENIGLLFARVVRSADSTVAKHIRPLFVFPSERRINHDDNKLSLLTIQSLDRPHLWTKVLCSNKTVDDVLQSSLVDSFTQWYRNFNFQAFSLECKREDDVDTADLSAGRTLSRFILEEATTLAQYIQLDLKQLQPTSEHNYIGNIGSDTDADAICRDLCTVLVFYYQNDKSTENFTTHSNPSLKDKWNPFIGPVFATLLSASIPLDVVSVMMSTIGPVAMPLIVLTNEERKTATTKLHRYFYQLACYHNPILVLHLDHYAPEWYLPSFDQADNNHVDISDDHRKNHGTIPITWFSSLLAGECIDHLPPKTLKLELLRRYWDASFLSQDNSLKFFLAAALLETHIDSLLALRGPDLFEELTGIMTFQITSPNITSEPVEYTETETFMSLWFGKAKLLQESTPRTFVEFLKEAENIVVKEAVLLRQKIIFDKEEKEEEERRKQLEAERIRKEEEMQYRFHLISFYEKHAPDKLSTVDNILKVYSGRIPLLNQRLKEKYGVGFIPVSVTKPVALTAIKTLKQSIQQGLKSIQERESEKGAPSTTQDETSFSPINLFVFTSPCEVMPSFFATEIENLLSSHQRLMTKFQYSIIDSRPDEISSTQGRFQKTITLSPETFDDPLSMNELRCQLESLRGDHHICIMGQGISSLSKLNAPSTFNEEDSRLQDLDDLRTSRCASFFINEGFPFVSIMNGGFAAAYSWMQQSFPSLESSVVTTTNRSVAPASLESTSDKTSRTVQKLLDRSMVALTLGEQKLEESFTKFFASKSGRT